jgi:hypothetical protein
MSAKYESNGEMKEINSMKINENVGENKHIESWKWKLRTSMWKYVKSENMAQP